MHEEKGEEVEGQCCEETLICLHYLSAATTTVSQRSKHSSKSTLAFTSAPWRAPLRTKKISSSMNRKACSQNRRRLNSVIINVMTITQKGTLGMSLLLIRAKTFSSHTWQLTSWHVGEEKQHGIIKQKNKGKA